MHVARCGVRPDHAAADQPEDADRGEIHPNNSRIIHPGNTIVLTSIVAYPDHLSAPCGTSSFMPKLARSACKDALIQMLISATVTATR